MTQPNISKRFVALHDPNDRLRANALENEITQLRQDKVVLLEVLEDELEYLLDEKQDDEMVKLQLDVRIAKHKAAIAKHGKES